MRRLTSAVLALLVVVGGHGLCAQPRDTTATDTFRVQLPEVTVQAARSAVTSASAPFSVTIETRSPEEVALSASTSLDDLLRPLSGVWVNDRHHFALGERISVRGVGYRSNFGVRGIQVLYNGIPLTLPDGQAFLDVVDPAVVRRLELIRSPASVFWGNGSGGVLVLSSRPTDPAPKLRARAQTGSYGQWQGLLEGTIQSGPWHVHGYASGQGQEGFRDHSAGYRLRGGLTVQRPLTDDTHLRLTAAGDAQDTENPSSLTREQFQSDVTQARPLFQQSNARKESEQGQIGVSIDHNLGGAVLSGSAYYLHRDLTNPLPFGFITYNRNSGGARVTLRRESGRVQGGIGVDGGVQYDDRIEYTTTDRGARGDSTTLDQLETVTSGSAFGYVRYRAFRQLAITGGLRVDGLRFRADDRLPIDGLDSGSRTFSAVSPALGLSYGFGPALLFAQYSTAFETPTASELSNRQDQRGGFNQSIQPQRTEGFEVGARGRISPLDLRFDVAVYRLQVDNLISSQRLPSGYQYYTNLGQNLHQGLEASLSWHPQPSLELALRYTGTRFRIQAPDPLQGNEVPGVPPHRGYVHVQGQQNGIWGRLSFEAVPEYYVDNANTATTPGYTLLDVRVGHQGLRWQSLTMKPFVAVDNLLDQRYAASVVVNAGDTFYEPGPQRSYSVGLNVTW